MAKKPRGLSPSASAGEVERDANGAPGRAADPGTVASVLASFDVGVTRPRRRIQGRGEAERVLASSYRPVRIMPQRPDEEFVMEATEARLGRLIGGVVAFNGAARLITAEAEQVHVNITLRGESTWRGNADRAIYARSGEGVVYNPGQAADTFLSDNCAHLCLMVPPDALESNLEALSGSSVPSTLRFAPSLRLNDSSAHLLAPVLKLLVAELNHPDSALRFPTVGRHVEGLILDSLLLGHQHNHSGLLDRMTRVSKTPIARAVELLEERPELPWTTGSLAQEVHLSVRALQEGFRRAHDLTPMAYLRSARLREVHRILEEAFPGSIRVQDVALRFGFLHLGRFAAAYRGCFGENPSATLARLPR